GRVLPRQQPKLRLGPAELAGGDLAHLRLGARPSQRHGEAEAARIRLEAVRLRRAGILAAGADLAPAVPVAEGQVIQPGAAVAVWRNGLRPALLLRAEIDHAAMREADA